MVQTNYDAIIIGSGQGGNPLAYYFAGKGKSVLLAEFAHVGGSCVNYGCTPTKTMAASARVAYLSKRGKDFGIRTGDVQTDMKAVSGRKEEAVQAFRGASAKSLEQNEHITLVRGHARFSGPNEVTVEKSDGGTLSALSERIYIDTGTRPAVPDIEGLEEYGYYTNNTVMDLTELPRHLLVIGGGYIGVEFAQMFRRFGSEVTIVQKHDQLIPGEDRESAEAVQEVLEEDGITVVTGSVPRRVIGTRDNRCNVEIKTPNGLQSVEASHLLAAAGRVPNTDDLGLEHTGVKLDSGGYIVADDYLQTDQPGVYVIGDVKGGPAFTHISYNDYMILTHNMESDTPASIKERPVPYVIYMDPEYARIGLSEEEAKARGIEYTTSRMDMKRVARAYEMGETRGFMKAVISKKDNTILGCTIFGVNGGEIMSALQIAMKAKIPYTDLRDAVFAHPTLMESLNNLFA